MQTRYLKTLVAAVDEGSFSRAAQTLNITQSAVSQRIKFLEEQFGCQLIDRSGNRLVMTPAGQLVLAKARDILSKERELLESLRGLNISRRLALCCTPTFGMAFLSRVLNAFLGRHADLADLKFVFLQPAEAVHSLRGETFDLAVIEHSFNMDLTGLDRYVLPDDELVFVAAPGCVTVPASGEVGCDAISALRLFARRDGCSSKEVMCQLLRQHGRELSSFENVVVSDDLRFTIQAVSSGQGIAFLSKTLVAGNIAAGELVAFHLRGAPQKRGRSALLLPGRQSDPLLNDLLEGLFEVVSPAERPQFIGGAR
jgi:DNA-binding transcriptional LysR family regulator